MSQQNFNRSQVEGKTLIVGFDFGTHSSKVVLRERGNESGRVARFDDPTEGYPDGTSPSVVRQVDDRLYFGSSALRRSGGTLHNSLKVRLLSDGSRATVASSDSLDHASLVAAYLAWAFQQIRESLIGENYANELLNLAAPMSHFENVLLKQKYLRILQAAWKLSFESSASPIRQGIPVSEVARLLKPLMTMPIQGEQKRRFNVLPETIAPVVSLSLDPWMEPGMYVILDIGAGTTEISVFHAGMPGEGQKVLCYRDETMLLGGNDLHLAERLEGDRRSEEISKIVSQLKKQYCRLWQMGYQVDAPNHNARKRWQELTLVLSGGGTKHPEVAAGLAEANPIFPWPESEIQLRHYRHNPGQLGRNVGMRDADLSMFAVANGLSIERAHWPILFQQNEIDQLEPSRDIEDKPDGYWYIDAK